jgi:hypothetical protein
MGTRADFYEGRGTDAEWLGSIAWDGYPEGLSDQPELLQATTAEGFKEAVAALLAERDDGTTPDQGWPWPWENSRTTDYAYAFDSGSVWASYFGHSWFPATEQEPEDETPKDAAFPDMSSRQRVTLGERSGLTVLAVQHELEPEHEPD